MTRPHSSVRSAIVALALAVVATACAASNQDAIEASGITEERANDPVVPVGPGGEASVVAGDLFFEDLEGVAVDGEVTFTIDNVGGYHTFVIDQAAGGETTIELPAGETTTGSLLLYGAAAGQVYTYYCDVPGHQAAGMEGRITVYLDEETAREAGGADASSGASDAPAEMGA